MKYLKIVLYILFSLVALSLWNKWQHDYAPAKKIETTIQNATANKVAAQQASELPSAVADHLNQAVGHVKHLSAPTTSSTPSTQTLTIKTDVLKLTINKLGGGIVEAQLLKYPLKQGQPEPIALLNNKAKSLYIAQSGLTNVPGLGNKPILYQSAKTSYQLANGQQQVKVNLTYQGQGGFKVTKTYILTKGSYAIGMNYQVHADNKAWQGRYYTQTKRRDYAGASKDHLLGFHTFFGIAISTPDDHYDKMSYKDLTESPLNQTIKGGWLAVIQHYFLSAWVPNAKEKFYYYSQALANKTYVMGILSQPINLKSGQQTQFGSQLYVGPEIATNLDQVSPYLHLTIDYGWLWFISVIIFWLLKHIYNIVGNWGWAIILVTILIKLIFYKFSETSYKSMAKMRALQPKLEQLKERFAGDKQQISKATMELYRKEKVNPLGGCLPILIQIPVFIALYWVLIESVELRQAPFILWIHNLAAPDPYYVLPIIMGGTMFLQQRLSPAPSDPMQAKIMMFLPVFFTVLFLKFPAGLVLYWTVNNGVSILQQWYITKRFKAGAYTKKKSKKK